VTGELDVFRAELRAAGQPWSRYGLWLVGLGMLLFAGATLVGQIAPIAVYFFSVLCVSVVFLVAGWACFVAAFVRRRRWTRAHPLIMPGLSEVDHGASEAQ
jgi:hypothetical protein